MRHLTLHIFLAILLVLSKQDTFGQALYEPLMLIKDNFLEINFDAKDEYCFYSAKREDLIENPEFRASLLCEHKIKSIKHSNSHSSFTESFDTNGHVISKGDFWNQSFVIDNSYNKFSFLAESTPSKNSFKLQELYKYDSDSNLIKYRKQGQNGFLKKAFKGEQRYKYDSSGNLTEIQGIKVFSYDETGRLRLQKEINFYGETYSKTNQKEGVGGKIANRQFKEYNYDSNGLLEQIEIKHYDSIAFKNYRITFEYDDFDRLVEIIKYHGSGEKWQVNQLEYSDGYLIANVETMYSGTSSHSTIVTTKYYYENGLITKSQEFFSSDRVENELSDEVYYGYTFY